MKPLIGITAATIYNLQHPYAPFTYGQKHDYVEAISRAGGIPVVLPITKNANEVKEIFERLDGIVFAGGTDINPHLYGEESRDSEEPDKPRDKHEVELMKLALKDHKPILAICRGMHLLNAIRGGTLYQDIVKEVPDAGTHLGYTPVKDPAHLIHTLSIVPESKLAKILGVTTLQSNSRHHQAVKDVGDGLVVNAYAEDGLVEGVEDMSAGYVMAVQPHPESLIAREQTQWHPLFESFIAAAKSSN
jgi:putative glutamine amidotransferase